MPDHLPSYDLCLLCKFSLHDAPFHDVPLQQSLKYHLAPNRCKTFKQVLSILYSKERLTSVLLCPFNHIYCNKQITK